MNHTFSHLVWLGASTASEPTGMLNNAARVTLFEAREAACKTLQKKFPQKNVTVIQAALTTATTTTDFIEYNLAEFSAIQPATGLKNLFPGLRAIHSEKLSCTAVSDAISSLKLSGNNNLLIVDIADSSLSLLNAIDAANQLHFFNTIHIQTANEPLYANSSTSKEITTFLHSQGYLLQQTTSIDSDLPWLVFFLNPLWDTLQQAQQNLIIERQIKDTAEKELGEIKKDLAEQQQARNNLVKELEKNQKTEQEQIKEIKKLRADLEKISAHATSRTEKIVQLEKTNRKLNEASKQLEKRHQALQQELVKAEAQIDVIKDLLLKY